MTDIHQSNETAGAYTPAASSDDAAFSRTDPPAFSATLWPNRSLTRAGFQRVIVFLCAGLAIPLIPFLGTPVGWGLLPFLCMIPIALYAAIQRNYRDGRLREDIRLWPDQITVERIESNGARRRWHANPYWVNMRLHENARIENYLTLKGNDREIELGAFLSPEERVALYEDIQGAMRGLRSA